MTRNKYTAETHNKAYNIWFQYKSGHLSLDKATQRVVQETGMNATSAKLGHQQRDKMIKGEKYSYGQPVLEYKTIIPRMAKDFPDKIHLIRQSILAHLEFRKEHQSQNKIKEITKIVEKFLG